MILAAIALYLLTAGACLWAAIHAPPRAPRLGWLVISLFFVALGAWRLAGTEEIVRAALRDALLTRGEYGVRESVQRPLAAALLLGATSMAVWAALRWRALGRHPARRALFWAQCGATAMAGLVAVRVVSLHATDTLLFSGPHLNRVIDPALALFVLVQAWLFARKARPLPFT